MNKETRFLLCVGAQKAGTSWLYEQLKSSKELQFSKNKEIHYFDYKFGHSTQLLHEQAKRISALGANRNIKDVERLLVNDNWYRKQFKNSDAICADFTPNYALLEQEELESIARLLKNVKVIYLMRNPRKRALSALKYLYKNKGVRINSLPEDEVKKMLAGKLIASRTNYSYTLKNCQRVFGSNFKYYFFEDIMDDKESSLKDICKFIGIDPVETSNVDKVVNEGSNELFSKEIISYADHLYSKTIEETKAVTGYIPDCWFDPI